MYPTLPLSLNYPCSLVSDYGVGSAKEANKWLENNFELNEAIQWLTRSISPENAKKWRAKSISPEIAQRREHAGIKP